VADAVLKRFCNRSGKEKKYAGIKKIGPMSGRKKANLHNKSCADCRFHFDDQKRREGAESVIFITEGDSAQWSITKSRDVETRVFSCANAQLLWPYQKSSLRNEEFNLLQHALNMKTVSTACVTTR